MHQAAKLQFERVIDEFVRWRAVPEDERSPAPAWWWGPAVAVLDLYEPMPADWCAALGLHDAAGYAEGARALLAFFDGQTSPPWPYDFPRRTEIADHDVRDLHPAPLDDSAFQP
jgi:hypothetical protein